jgi:hypothetical protein
MATLGLSQLQMLSTDIAFGGHAEVDAAMAVGNLGAVANYYNKQYTPAYTMWNPVVSQVEFAFALDGEELFALTIDNVTRFINFLQFFQTAGELNANNEQMRIFMGLVFADANKTQENLAMIWRTNGTNSQVLYADGTGSGTSADPGTMTVWDPITTQNVIDAVAIPARR